MNRRQERRQARRQRNWDEARDPALELLALRSHGDQDVDRGRILLAGLQLYPVRVLVYNGIERAMRRDGIDVDAAQEDGTWFDTLIEWIQNIDWDRLFNEILPALLEFIITIIGLFSSTRDHGIDESLIALVKNYGPTRILPTQ